MKTKFFLLAVLPLFMFVSCEKHECNALSWTDYNSVEDVHCHFDYLKDESRVYIGDTLKVYGWLTDSIKDNNYWYTLTTKKDLLFSHNGSAIYSNPYVHLHISEKFKPIIQSRPYDSLLYVTGIIIEDGEFTNYYLDVINVNS